MPDHSAKEERKYRYYLRESSTNRIFVPDQRWLSEQDPLDFSDSQYFSRSLSDRYTSLLHNAQLYNFQLVKISSTFEEFGMFLYKKKAAYRRKRISQPFQKSQNEMHQNSRIFICLGRFISFLWKKYTSIAGGHGENYIIILFHLSFLNLYLIHPTVAE